MTRLSCSAFCWLWRCTLSFDLCRQTRSGYLPAESTSSPGETRRALKIRRGSRKLSVQNVTSFGSLGRFWWIVCCFYRKNISDFWICSLDKVNLFLWKFDTNQLCWSCVPYHLRWHPVVAVHWRWRAQLALLSRSADASSSPEHADKRDPSPSDGKSRRGFKTWNWSTSVSTPRLTAFIFENTVQKCEEII